MAHASHGARHARLAAFYFFDHDMRHVAATHVGRRPSHHMHADFMLVVVHVADPTVLRVDKGQSTAATALW